MNVPAEGLLSKAYAKERAALIDPKHASKTYVAGDPLKYDSKVKEWPYWKASVIAGAVATAADVPESSLLASLLASLGRDSAGVSKDTTHMPRSDAASLTGDRQVLSLLIVHSQDRDEVARLGNPQG